MLEHHGSLYSPDPWACGIPGINQHDLLIPPAFLDFLKLQLTGTVPGKSQTESHSRTEPAPSLQGRESLSPHRQAFNQPMVIAVGEAGQGGGRERGGVCVWGDDHSDLHTKC